MSESVTLQRDYPASPERMFEAWTSVELLSQWFGCGPGMLWTVHEWDVRVGGALHVSLAFDKGPFEVRGTFLVVEAPRHLRYTFADDQIVDVLIEPLGSGSRVTVRHTGLGDGLSSTITGGWTNGLAQLAGLQLSTAGARAP